MNRLIFLGCVMVLGGCAQGHPATNDSLALPIDVTSGAVTDSRITFTIAGGYAQATPVTMQVAAPQLKVHTTADRAEIDELVMPLGDVTIPASALPPNGLILRKLALKAGPAHAAIMHAENDALELRAKLPLELDWSVQLQDGSLYPLGAVHTEPVNVDIHVFRANNEVQAEVQAACLGTCWSVDGVATLSDGAVYLEAAADVTPAE